MSDITFLTKGSIDIVRIEHRHTHIGVIETMGPHNHHKHILNILISSEAINLLVSKSVDPSQWRNSFGDMWRRHIQEHHGKHYNPKNAPWRFALKAIRAEELISQSASLLMMDIPEDNGDMVIARYTCPANTWYENKKDGQIAFLYEHAIRHEQVIDRHTVHTAITQHAHTKQPSKIRKLFRMAA